MSIESCVYYYAVCDGCGAEYEWEDARVLYESAPDIERDLQNSDCWTERDGKHFCGECVTPEKPAPPSLPLFPEAAVTP